MDIEYDIKILHKIISFYKDLDILYDKDKCSEIQAIEHILAEREENKKYTIHLTDEEYRKVIENAQKDVETKYKKKIEELEVENKVQRHQIMTVYDNGYVHKDKIKDDYIPKQKVIEEIDKVLKAFRKVEFNRITGWNSLVQLKENLLGDK